MKEEKIRYSSIKWLYIILGSDRWTVILLTVVRIAGGLLTTWSAVALKNVIDACVARDSHLIAWRFALLLAVLLMSAGLTVLGNYWEERGRATMERRFRLRIFSQLMDRSYARVSSVHSEEWMTRISSDSMVVAQSITGVFPNLLGLIVQAVSAMYALAVMLPSILYVLIPGGVFLTVYSVFFRKRLKERHRDMQREDGGSRSFMQERLSGMVVIRAHSWEQYTKEQADRRLDRWKYARLMKARCVCVYNAGMQIGMQIGYLAGIGLCCMRLLQGRIGYGAVIAVLQLTRQAGAITNLSGFAPQYYAMMASIERMREVEDYPYDCEAPLRSRSETGRFYGDRFRSLGFRDASFLYPDTREAVLEGFSMDIRKGEYTAFVGASGSGKTTVLKLLLGLYRLDGGEMYVRDMQGTERPLDASWRTMFAYVPQGNHIFTGSVREAVTFGSPDETEGEERLWETLSVACADGFVRELPRGLDTELGERGSGLSEGQMQRLAIARAIYSRNPILILDEATSALEPETERRLLQNLRTRIERTVILVTHRPAALEFCDVTVKFG